MKPLRVGIIGFGGAGKAHLFYYSRLKAAKVTKIYDIKKEGLERASAAGGHARVCSELDEFWKDLDSVSICSPDSTHADYLEAALDHGLHVLCEKPLTDSIEGLIKIKRAEEHHPDRIVAVLHQMRFIPMNLRMKELVETGRLGPISYLEGYYVHNLMHRAFAFDDWRSQDNATPLLYAGCHFVDLLRWFVNDEIEEIHASSNHLAFPQYPEADLTVAMFRFKKGALGKVLVTFGSACPQDHSVRIYGRDGCIENNLFFDSESRRKIIHSPYLIEGELLDTSNPRSYLLDACRQIRGNWRAYLFDKGYRLLDFLFGRYRDAEYYNRFYPIRLYEHSLACVRAIRDFIEAIDHTRKPECTVDEAAKTVLACLAGLESYRSGQPVKVRTLNEVTS